MDIQISSNFERYLYHLAENSAEKLQFWMDYFERNGKLTIEDDLLKKAKTDFVSASVEDGEILEMVRRFHQENGYLLDPHTAVGVRATEKNNIQTPVICLACAHPAKFGQAIREALGSNPELPDELAALENLKTRSTTVLADPETIKKVMLERLEA